MLRNFTTPVAAGICALALAAAPAFAAGSGANKASEPGNTQATSTMNSGSSRGKSGTNPAGQQASNGTMRTSNYPSGANGSGSGAK